MKINFKQYFKLERWFKDPKRVMNIALLLVKDFERCDLFRHASAMSYVTVFSIVPSLAAITSILSSFSPMFSHDQQLMGLFERMFNELAPSAISGIFDYLKNMLGTLDFKAIGATGVIALFFSLALLLRQIEIAFNRIWLVRTPRNMFKRFLYFWTFTTLSLFVFSLGLAVFANFKLAAILQSTAEQIHSTFSFTAVIANWFLSFIVFFSLYKIIPNCSVRVREAAVGGALATVLFQIITKSYTFFITSIADYSKLYGTLAALPTFFLWLYLSWLIIMLGALFAWRWQQGFPDDAFFKEEDNPKNQLSSPEIFKTKIWTSAMSLVLVYRWFESKDSPISVLGISQILNVPIEIVSEQVDMLVKLKLIAVTNETSIDESPLNNSLLPKHPANRLTLGEALTAVFGRKLTENDNEVIVKFVEHFEKNISPRKINELDKIYLSEILNFQA